MTTVRKSISFTDKQNNWIQNLIKQGEYTNESEYIRDLVRKDKERLSKYEKLSKALEIGLKSGESNKDLLDVMEDVENKLRKNGQL